MDLINLLITIVSGAAGGNIAGAVAPSKTLGVAGNSIIGLIGGGLGHYILKHYFGMEVAPETIDGVVKAAQEMNFKAILENVGASGAGGAILTFIVGIIKSAVDKKG